MVFGGPGPRFGDPFFEGLVILWFRHCTKMGGFCQNPKKVVKVVKSWNPGFCQKVVFWKLENHEIQNLGYPQKPGFRVSHTPENHQKSAFFGFLAIFQIRASVARRFGQNTRFYQKPGKPLKWPQKPGFSPLGTPKNRVFDPFFEGPEKTWFKHCTKMGGFCQNPKKVVKKGSKTRILGVPPGRGSKKGVHFGTLFLTPFWGYWKVW